ncbi:MAG: EcsC family protein [Wenzhouxiangellaceae bacterium]|nr:EcsC family protein [Wenzhouxiangellaceae bacterium]
MGELAPAASPLSSADLNDLAEARRLLENPSLAARLSDLVGRPLEGGLQRLPDGWRGRIDAITNAALERALQLAISTLNEKSLDPALKRHRFAAALSGGLGGAFGLPALAVELPVSTTLMLRSIGAIAQAQGESLDSPEARVQCLQVFALGGPTRRDDATETGYFATRALLARAVSEAAAHFAGAGLGSGSAPALARLITAIASRFSIVVSQKAAAQAVPLVGAVGGAMINAAFIEHFQGIARGHFTIRRLERRHGQAWVRERYQALLTDN